MAFGVLHGARAKLGFYDGGNYTSDGTYISGGQFNYVGIFSDVSWSVNMDVQGAWILGSYVAAATEYVAQDLVHVSATGWRILDHSWYKDAKFPKLAEIMTAGYLTMNLQDRQSGADIGTISKLRPASASVGFSPRSLASVTHSYLGIYYSDETAPDNFQDATAAVLPPS
jgi:hypothetical protein